VVITEQPEAMISKTDLQRLVQRPAGQKPVLSLFLDMSVNAENKRTHNIFLNQQRARFAELSSERDSHHREPIGAALARIEEWLESDFEQVNKGVAIFIELGGGWFEALQFPVRVRNRMLIAERPAVGPLTEVLGAARRYGLILVDRERLRLFATYLGEVVADESFTMDPYPTPHDVKAGGFAAKDHQKRKEEEAHRFFREFSSHVETFDRRHAPQRWVLLGTDDNRSAFLGHLGAGIAGRIVHEAHAPMDATPPQLLERLDAFFVEDATRDRAEVIERVRERVRNRHFAIAGLSDTLEQLQEGKVETLVLARDLEQDGAQCTKCSFYLLRRNSGCPYCGGELREGVDLVESMLRIAAEQDVAIEFADPGPLRELDGVGALLRF
jgi:peptide subunit release factor 1 (eRF1)